MPEPAPPPAGSTPLENKPTAGALADAILVLLAAGPALWWTAWLLAAVRSARPLEDFPFGAKGFVFVAAAAVAASASLWRLLKSVPASEASAPLDGRDAAAFGSAALLILLFWEKSLIRGWIPVNGFFLYMYHPLAALVGQAVQSGQLPLWNPWANAGMPLMADPPVAAFSSLHLPLHLSSVPAGHRVWLVSVFFLLYSFTHLWLRDRRLNPASCFAGGVTAALSAYAAWRAGYLSHLESFLWLPAVLHALQRRSLGAAALAAAHQVLAGHYQFAYMTILAATALLLLEKASLKRWLWTSGAALLGGCLAAFQLFPSIALARESLRSGVLGYDAAVAFSIPLGQLVKMLFVPLWIHFRPAVGGDPQLTVYYTGTAALVLAALSFRRWKAPGVRLGATLAAIGVLLSLGKFTPVYGLLLRVLPGLSLFRFPAQWMGLILFGTVLLVAEGTESLKEGPRRWGAGCLVAADLLLFNLKPSHLWVDPSFLTDPPAALRELRTAEGRLMETPRLEAWRYGDLPADRPRRPSFAPWLAVKESLAPSQGMAYHVGEAKSITNHTPAAMAALQREADAGGAPGLEALKRLGVARVLDIEDPAAETPVFRVHRVAGPRAFLRTLSGEAVAARVEGSAWNVKDVRLERPWDGAGPLVLGEACFPGWSARTKDGVRAIAPADGPFPGVSLRPGDAALRLRYEAPAFFVGIAFSLAALLFLVFAGTRGPAGRPESLLMSRCLAGMALLMLAKGFHDCFWGIPYADHFSNAPWEFVSVRQYSLFARAELLSALLLGLASLDVSRARRDSIAPGRGAAGERPTI